MSEELVRAAVTVRERAYAPYSRFHVGAALRDEHGQIHVGCNVENAAYPQGSCAEAGAIAGMIMKGARHISEIVIAGGGDQPCTPCGGCRQRIREFASPDARVTMVNPSGEVLLVRTLGELLPDSFGPDHLGSKRDA